MRETWRSWVYDCLAEHELRSRTRAVVTGTLIALVMVGVVCAALGTLPDLDPLQRQFLHNCGRLAWLLFSVEYFCRIWIAPEGDPQGGKRPWSIRRRYLLSFIGVVDLLVILPQWLGLVLPVDADIVNLGLLLGLLKAGRYAPALPLVAAVFRNEGRSLLAGLMVMMVLLVLVSGVMFTLEHAAQPAIYVSIPHTMWWAIVTMATVGYGDMVPVTPLGKVFGGFTMLLGIAMFAVPAGILATGFATEIRKRDFVVTWHTVAKVPLFANLDATRIAGIARLLKTQIVPAHQVVMRRGEPADAMFFIMSGEVEVDVLPHPLRLGKGQYVGEIALIMETTRTATVTTLTECQLLALEVNDFRQLAQQHPDLREAIKRVAETRLQGQQPTSGEPPKPEGSG
jgi:voltage-gated potassium channel